MDSCRLQPGHVLTELAARVINTTLLELHRNIVLNDIDLYLLQK